MELEIYSKVPLKARGLPLAGWFKCNFDAVVRSNTCTKFRVVFRDAEVVIASATKFIMSQY